VRAAGGSEENADERKSGGDGGRVGDGEREGEGREGEGGDRVWEAKLGAAKVSWGAFTVEIFAQKRRFGAFLGEYLDSEREW